MTRDELQEFISEVDRLFTKQAEILTLMRKELIPSKRWDGLISALENMVIALNILKTSVILMKESEE